MAPGHSDHEGLVIEGAAQAGGAKRKRGEPKFYAVRNGKKPGIYQEWSDCLAQIKGYSSAAFKAFTSLKEAEEFMNPNSKSAMSSTPKKYYAVQVGRVPGIYTDWPSALEQITGWKGPKYKGFATRAEAEAFVRAGKQSLASSPIEVQLREAAAQGASRKAPTVPSNGAPPSKRQRKSASSDMVFVGGQAEGTIPPPGLGLFPPDSEDGFDRSLMLDPMTGNVQYKPAAMMNATRLQPNTQGDPANGILTIYTDGSSRANGSRQAVAGVGVYFGPQDSRNVSEPLPGPRQTNQRAELTAIMRALEIAPLHRDVNIILDNMYAIKCCTEWFQKWEANNWLSSDRKPVENRDLVEKIVQRLRERKERCGVNTHFEWVKGHSSNPGNTAADALAVRGALAARASMAQAQ